MATRSSVVKQVLETLVGDTEFATNVGISTYEQLEGWYNTLAGYDQIMLIARAVNSLEDLDPLLDPVTFTSTKADYSEAYTRAVFEEAGEDLDTLSTKPEMQDFSLKYKDYGTSVRITNKQMMRDEIGVVQMIINAVVPAYRAKTRQIKLAALMNLPTDESKKIACLWRDTSGFSAAADQIAPYPNGLLEFANTDTHYLANNGMAETLIDTMVTKIVNKGYGQNGVAVVANRTWWNAYRAQFTQAELEVLKLRNELAMKEFPTEDAELYIQVSDAAFPGNYAIAFDPTVEGIWFKIAEKVEMQGLVPGFKTLDEARVNREADFNIFETGAGIIERGFACIMYTGGATYTNPDLTIKG